MNTEKKGEVADGRIIDLSCRTEILDLNDEVKMPRRRKVPANRHLLRFLG